MISVTEKYVSVKGILILVMSLMPGRLVVIGVCGNFGTGCFMWGSSVTMVNSSKK